MSRRARPAAEALGQVALAPANADGSSRSTPLRLARIHLRMGSLLLARAELESLAGHSMLDEDAMLDLAEVRWRTGDLAGAGDAANALLGRGREDTLALVIAAEAIAALGRPGEARRLAARALASSDGPLDPLFAGIPRSSIWPGEVVEAVEGEADSHGEDPPPASTGAAEAYAGGRAALGAGDTAVAAVRLGVALRLEPAYAKDVLEALGDRDDPALSLVEGDALRLLGRESEALAAFDRARGHRAIAVADPSMDAAVDDAEDDDLA